jgi:hypothetical protein
MKIKQSTIEFTKKVLKEALVDIDIEYCIKHNINYENNHINSEKFELFNTASNKSAFDLVFRSNNHKKQNN